MSDQCERLEADRDAWKCNAEADVKDLQSVIKKADNGCLLCVNSYPCKGTECSRFTRMEEARVSPWSKFLGNGYTCNDVDYGIFPVMGNTLCNGCDFENHWHTRE